MWVGPGDYASVINLNSSTNATFSLPWGSAATLDYFMFGAKNESTSDFGFYQDL